MEWGCFLYFFLLYNIRGMGLFKSTQYRSQYQTSVKKVFLHHWPKKRFTKKKKVGWCRRFVQPKTLTRRMTHPGWEPRLARQQRHQSLVVLQQLVASLATLLRRLHGETWHGWRSEELLDEEIWKDLWSVLSLKVEDVESWIVHRCVNEKLNFIDRFECCQWYSWECSWCHRGCWLAVEFLQLLLWSWRLFCRSAENVGPAFWLALCSWRNLFWGILRYTQVPSKKTTTNNAFQGSANFVALCLYAGSIIIVHVCLLRLQYSSSCLSKPKDEAVCTSENPGSQNTPKHFMALSRHKCSAWWHLCISTWNPKMAASKRAVIFQGQVDQ